jgi:CRISPR-associated protein Csd1
MLLQRLNEYAQRLDITPAMYKPTPVPWIIDLDDQGRLLGLIRTSGGGKRDRGKVFTIPYPGVRTSGVKANLLVDKAEYVLGLERDNKSSARHDAFLELLRECAKATGEQDVRVLLSFLENLDRSALNLPDELTPDQWITFNVAGGLPVDLPTVQAFWAARITGQGDAEAQNSMTCIVCGTECFPVSPHPGNIKGIPNGQTSGMALISANSNAFESYGLKRSVIAPTCNACAERYVIAANDLIQRENTHLRVGPLIYLFWTKQDTGFSLVSLISKPDPDDVKALINSAWKGREYSALDKTTFYATAFSASGARVAVRDWLESTIGNVQENLARWFVLQQIVDGAGDEGHPYGIYPLCASMYRDANRDMVANVPKTLLRAALHGEQLPMWLLYQAVRRNRAEQGVTRPRMALIKMVLLSGERGKEDTMKQLETENTNPAYLCGRLFAVLESVQRAAMPNINNTIADRFFGTASSAPASVFGRLIRGSQSHLGKLRRERKGAYEALQQRLEEIQSKLDGFPATLPLKEQGMFALGYYHQRAMDRAAAKAARAKSTTEENKDKD